MENVFMPVILFIYMLFFIFAHELGHILALKIFNVKPDKVGVKLNYIFPAFYVRMNDVYFLDKIQKIVVHSAGIFSSLLINSIVLFVAYINGGGLLHFIGKYMMMDIFINMFPVLNSDGYKILITLFDMDEKKEKNCNCSLIKIFRLFNVFLVGVYIFNSF